MFGFSKGNYEFVTWNNEPIEGFLGGDNPELLFILKEPNTNGGEQDGFWFKKVVNNEDRIESKKYGTKYINVLGKISQHLLGEKGESFETTLKKCSYINFYPFSGNEKVNSAGGYSCMYKTMTGKRCRKETLDKIQQFKTGFKDDKTIIDKNFSIEDLIENRKNLIKKLCHNGVKHIVTVQELYAFLKDDGNGVRTTVPPTIGKINNSTFHKCRLNTEYSKAYLYSFYHPSNRFSYEKLDNALRS